MKVIVQRSQNSNVIINNKIYNKIDKGLVLLVSFHKNDDETIFEYIINKILHLRIFNDEKNIMNKNILEINGEILSISQFTLYADIKKGNRPSYINAKNHDDAKILYDKFNKELAKFIPVKTGIFGEDMLVNIHNDGPVTIIIEKNKEI